LTGKQLDKLIGRRRQPGAAAMSDKLDDAIKLMSIGAGTTGYYARSGGVWIGDNNGIAEATFDTGVLLGRPLKSSTPSCQACVRRATGPPEPKVPCTAAEPCTEGHMAGVTI
jgi:hypothetical protein